MQGAGSEERGTLPAAARPGAGVCLAQTGAVIRDVQFRARAAAVGLFGTDTKGTSREKRGGKV